MKIAVDASALLSILLGEPGSEQCLSKLLLATTAWISPINLWEVQVRVRSVLGEAGSEKTMAWIQEIGIVVEPTTLAQAVLAIEAHRKYQGRPARLNMGDCFAYALAKSRNVPLLFKGSDFLGTDLSSA